MLKKPIPFEIHITTQIYAVAQQDDFVNFCLANDAKPLLIELSRGQSVSQPMLSKIVVSDDFREILIVANQLSLSLSIKQFAVRRLKIEVPADEAALFSDFKTGFKPYFEWHGKIDYKNIEVLEQILEDHQVHLSHNALKNQHEQRFITLREYGTKTVFDNRVNQLGVTLATQNRKIQKPQSEYCIYDNNQYLDDGWLIQ